MMDFLEEFLPKVKNNLIISFDEDDDLIKTFIIAALDYAQERQKLAYSRDKPPSEAAKQAVVMLASHFYESRDGSSAGFFAGQAGAAKQVWDAVNRLLVVGKRWDV